MKEFDEYLIIFLEEADKGIENYEYNLSRISTGRANPQLIRKIKVNYYESLTPLEEISLISVPEPQQLLVKPYDISSVREITSALNNANLGVEAINEGNQVRMTFPTLTTERRKEMVKQMSKYTEQARIAIRNGRHNALKLMKADELPEDLEKRYSDMIQKQVDKYNETISKLTDAKTKELTSM